MTVTFIKEVTKAFFPWQKLTLLIKQKNKFHWKLIFLKLGYQDSNLEMLESESSALPFGDSPMYYFLCDFD
jgi:hypothetical protein